MRTWLRSLACLVAALSSGGCASLVSSAASGLAANLSTAILDQEDPDLVRDGTPAYLLLLDSFVQGSPDDPAILGSASQLYAAYGTAFVNDADRARTLTSRARDYGDRALCAADRRACDLASLDFSGYETVISSLKPKSADALFSYAVGSLAYIRAHSSDWTALADLPKIELALNHLLDLDPGARSGDIYKYLGILNTLRPPALGGRPERGKDYFERAIEATGGRDLSVKLEYARDYARLVYDRELHDQLLQEVLAGTVRQPGLTLFNSMAQQQAKALLASADDYF